MDKRHLFIVIGLLYLFIGIYITLNSSITGYVIYEDKFYNFDFFNQSSFIFDNNLITLAEGVVSLVPYNNETNLTVEEASNSYLSYAEYQQGSNNNSMQDVTSKLNSQGGQWVNFREGHIFNIRFDKNLSNNDIVRFYLKGDNEDEDDEGDEDEESVILFMCNNINCDINYGSTNYIFIPSD